MPVIEKAPERTSIEFVLEQLAALEINSGVHDAACNGCHSCAKEFE